MNIRAWIAGLLGFAAAACAVAPGGAPESVPGMRALALRNPGFEEPERPAETCPVAWDCSMHNNVDSYRFVGDTANPAAGRRSLCVQQVMPEQWALMTQVIRDPALQDHRIRLSMLVWRQDGDGPGAGPFVQAFGSRGGLADAKRLVSRTRGWERVAVELEVPLAADYLVAGFSQEGGGRSCVDDVRLEVAESP